MLSPFVSPCPLDLSPSLRHFLDGPLPRTPEDLLLLEQDVRKAAAQEADLFIAGRLKAVHEDKAFVKQAIEAAKANCSYPLVSKGPKETSIRLEGGTRIVIKTPYLRQNHKGKRGPKRKKRGKKGTGIYPVLEALGIRDGVSPATRSEIALLTVQVGSYQEAVDMLERRGFSCDVSTLKRIATTTARAHICLRDAALEAATRIPVLKDAPLAGKRVRVSVDGGRVRTRKTRRGRKTRKGRHKFTTPWREPRVLVIDILDEKGKRDPLTFPLYDAFIKDADATFSVLIGYLRLLGAAHAQVVEFISDGADWIWDRVDRLITDAEIPENKLVQVVDFYHASEHLHDAVQLCKNLSAKERKKLYHKLLRALRHDPEGVTQVIEQLKQLATTRRGKKMKKALSYFENHATRMRYHSFEQMKLPIGSGQVESAVRRIINLRFKAPGSFWKEHTVDGLMHLRAYFKAGRWDQLINQVLTGRFEIPSFQPQPSPKNSSPSPLRDISMAACSWADDYQELIEGAI
jgi:hypothetical protein